MPNTYTEIHIHFVFAVKYRKCLIHIDWKADLYKYITGIIQKNEHKLIIINGIEDHVHILVGLRPTQSISDLMKDVKQFSSKWINENKLVKGKFEWQGGFGAFSYSKSHLKNVIKYIKNQEEHHKKQTFVEEYKETLKKYEIDYKDEYCFHEPI